MKRVFVFEYLTAGGAADALETLLPSGLRMRDAMVGDLLAAGRFEVTAATSARVPAPAPPARPCAAPGGESLFAFVARQAEQHDAVWLVAPETRALLASFQQSVPPARWLGCDGASIALASSKGRTLARLHEVGIATPLAFACQARRWVCKPDDGAGAVATTLHDDQAAARRAAAAGGMTVEPWVDGEAMSLSLLCTAGRSELLSVNRQQIEIDSRGRLAYCGVVVDERQRSADAERALAALAAQVASAIPGLNGFVGIDIVVHAQRGPVVIEVNPRLTCAYIGLSQRLGRNVGAEMVDALHA